MNSRTWNYDVRRAPHGVRLMLLMTDGNIVYSELNTTNQQSVKAWAAAGAKREVVDGTAVLERIEARLARMEARECQLMYHLGLDPKSRTYDSVNKHAETTGKRTPSNKSFDTD